MSSDRSISTWRTTAFRLALLYGGIFAVGVTCLLALVYFSMTQYIDQQTDQVLEARLASGRLTPAPERPRQIAEALGRDARHIDVFGLFAADGTVLAGNAVRLPGRFVADGRPRSLKVEGAVMGRADAIPMRLLVVVLPDAQVLLLGREDRQIVEIQHVVLQAAAEAVLVAVVGTLFGMRLAVVPVRRIDAIRRVSQQIVNGEIGQRLPVSARDDEIDMLAAIVNRMLDEIERRMVDIKGAADSVAHNLRTPLTRLRVMLNRLTSAAAGNAEQAIIEQAVAEADVLLARFRALLRISEISGSVRHAAFEKVDLRDTLASIHDLFAPLAEEKQIAFGLALPAAPCIVQGDGALLFEAVLNLVDNALKFTDQGGRVDLRLDADGTLAVADDGPGIPPGDRRRVMQPFYRGEAARNLPGSGVGLSIVGAIAHLHGFRFEFASPGTGTCALLRCGG